MVKRRGFLRQAQDNEFIEVQDELLLFTGIGQIPGFMKQVFIGLTVLCIIKAAVWEP
jgi:hypothetical protein